SDSFVLELTPQEKFFYLYLISNTKSTQCGIYEISPKFIAIETGYSKDDVQRLIKRFCNFEKILYCDDTKEIMVLNWIKYNAPNNNNAIIGVQKELKRVKNKAFLEILFKKCKDAELDVEKIFKKNIIDNDKISKDCYLEKLDKPSVYDNSGNITDEILLIPEDKDYAVEKEGIGEAKVFSIYRTLGSPLVGACKGLPSNRIRSKEQVVINKEKQLINKEEEVNSDATSVGIKNIIKVFEENIHALSPFENEKILEFTNQVTSEVIIMAIEEAVIYNAKTMKYITKIINNWISNGIETADQVKAYQKSWDNKKASYLNLKVKKSDFCDYEQRTYDFDVLEKQLLG
ncbi:MAG TPA: DnaD domain protein, partial [Clostridium sp.]|uniref:DnaD domain-containing protein n=1 Tax=Clostridium sp. TaxID=1506 RepID=UPI002F946065